MRRAFLLLSVSLIAASGAPLPAQMASAPMPETTTKALGVFGPADAAKLLPETVFFEEKTAPVQVRNSGGVRFSQDASMFAALVDASGYSSSVQEKYQAYLITEVALAFGDKTLPAGAYGCGFLGDGTFLVMDVGGHTLFTVRTARDTAIKRPTPLQVLADAAPGRYRLYEGRNFVTFGLQR